MAELSQRSTSARIIRNVLAYTQNAEFPTRLLIDLRNRGEHVETAWTRFNDNHNALVRHAHENSLNEELNEHNQLFDEIEEAYLTASASLQGRLRETVAEQDDLNGSVHTVQSDDEPPEQEDNNVNNTDNQDERIQPQNVSIIPGQGATATPIYVQCGGNRRIENYWGEFDGTLTKWRAFHDGFKAAVHDDKHIPPVFKFQYLKSSLRGRALAAFGEWELTADNYAEAWEQLREMYQLKYQTSQELVFKFLNLPKIEHPTYENIEKLSTVTNGVIRQLRALQYPVQHYDLFIVHCLHQKLDGGLSKEWEKERTSETPTIAEMLAFLNKQAKSCKSAYATDTRKRI